MLVHSSGVYPEAMSVHGESTRDALPHFRITYTSSVSNGPQGRSVAYRSICLSATHRPEHTRNGATMTLTLWQKALPDVADIEPHLAEAKAQVARQGRVALEAVPQRYAEAWARIDQADAYGHVLSRGEYEAACEALGVEVVPDDRCNGRGDFTFPSYDAETVLARRLSQRRAAGKQKEMAAAAGKAECQPATGRDEPVRPQGQLWEPCPHCGQEPVWMPLHVCMSCWPG